MSVLAPSVGILWGVIESYGLDPDALFRAEGLEIRWPVEPGTRLPYSQVDSIRARAAEASGDPAFGLRTARCAHPSHFGALGYAVLASSTLRESFERIQRYGRVLNDRGRVEIIESGGELHLRLFIDRESKNPQVRDDAIMAFIISLCRFNAGRDFNANQVTFEHDPPDDPGPWETLFRCPLRFGADYNELTLSVADADRVLPSANPVLAKMNERIVIQRLAKLDRDNIPGRVRAAIMEQLPSGKVSDESVADALHMTARTLHRKLKDDGETFRSLLKSVRMELAAQYIADDSLTLTEITFLLGFSEMSSFSRAYRNWHGRTPSADRQRD